MGSTCITCGQATTVVHGGPDAPGPCPDGSIGLIEGPRQDYRVQMNKARTLVFFTGTKDGRSRTLSVQAASTPGFDVFLGVQVTTEIAEAVMANGGQIR